MTIPDFMIDIETLSTKPNACIASIGVVKFDRKGPIKKLDDMEQFYTRVHVDSCKKLDMHVDPSTQAWWDKQDKEIRWEALENPEDRVDIKVALEKLSAFIGKPDSHVWGNGDDFDCVILNEAYSICGLTTPWKFWNTRDVRTVFDLAGMKPWDLPSNSKHHPVHDCYRQIWGVKKSLVKLGM